MNADRAVSARFRRQLGLVTRAQAIDAGMHGRQIVRLVQAGVWERRLPSVYAHSAVPRTRDQAILAAVLWAGGRAWACSHTAAELRGIRGRADGIHLLVDRSNRRRHHGIVVHRSIDMVDADRASVRGIPVTSTSRTIADLAVALDEHALELVLEDALRRRMTSMPRLIATHERLRGSGHAGCRTLGRLLAARHVDWVALQHELERRTWRLLVESGLPEPARQHRIELDGFSVHVDFAWPDQRVALEVDGWGPHQGRRLHHRDRERWSELALEWRVQVVGWDHVVEDPSRLLTRLRRLLGVQIPVR